MLFITLATLWTIFLVLLFLEAKNKNTRLLYNIINVVILGFYIWNIATNFNIQNTAALLIVITILCISMLLIPKAEKANNKKALKTNNLVRICLSCINLIVMIVHVIVFVIVGSA